MSSLLTNISGLESFQSVSVLSLIVDQLINSQCDQIVVFLFVVS